jgi:hypothetical protein
MTAIVCLAPVIDCQSSPTRGLRRNAGGAMGWRLSVKQKKETPYILRGLCIGANA